MYMQVLKRKYDDNRVKESYSKVKDLQRHLIFQQQKQKKWYSTR